MNKLNIGLAIAIIVCCVISAALVFSAEPQELFSTSGNAGEFQVKFISHNNTSDTHIQEIGEDYVYYFSDDSIVNVWVADIDSSYASKIAYTQNYQSFNPQDVNGTVVYTSYSNTGNHSGETRFIAFDGNRDTGIVTAVSSKSPNETSFIMQNLEVSR